MRKRKKSIFNYILVPLLAVMILQGIFTFITFQYSGTTKLVHENAVKILRQTTVNRKNLLENYLVSGCANVGKEKQELEEQLNVFLEKQGSDLTDFLDDRKLQEAYLVESAPIVIEGLRESKGTGAFLILADKIQNSPERQGIYLRDSDADQDPSNNTDLNLLRGRAEVGKLLNIPLGTLWTGSFQFAGLSEEQTAYYHNPVNLAMKNLDTNYKNLGYWSEPFCMDANTCQDSYQQITYSIPLIYQGIIYGVYGIELEVEYLKEMLPTKEIDETGQGSYLLAHCYEIGNMEIILESGKLLTVSGIKGNRLQTVRTEYEGLYKIQGTDLYCMISPLNLYNRNSPFIKERPSLVTVTTQEKLFGMGESLSRRFLLTILVSLTFGSVCIYLIAEHTTTPIRKMAEFISKSKGRELRSFECTNVKEMDSLYDVICNLTEQQLKTQEELREERERYLIALESTTDIIFEYQVEPDTLIQYMFNEDVKLKYGTGYIEQKVREGVVMYLEEQQVMSAEDAKKLTVFLRGQDEYGTVCIEIGENEADEDYGYYEFRGKTIYDAEGEPLKVIGSIGNVTSQMQQHIKEENRKHYDGTTGLLNLKYGRQQITAQENWGKECQAVLIDILHFKEFNDKLGLTFGDMILEELGEMLKRLLKCPNLAVRGGGDQLLLFLMEQTAEEAFCFAENFYEELNSLKKRTDLTITVRIGIAAYPIGSLDFTEMLSRVCLSAKWAKCRPEGGLVIYENLSEKDKTLPLRRKDMLREIMSIEYEKNLSLTKILYNAFDKVADAKAIMPFLLGKICKRYHFSDAVISVVDYDFYTSQIAYEWHSPDGRIPMERVFKCSREQFYEMIRQAEPEGFRRIRTELQEPLKEFFFLAGEGEAICFPMMEEGRFAGELVFLRGNGSQAWDEADIEGLEEVVNVIRTNLSRNKLDLASKAKSEFLSRMSHEIRTPMNAILGMCNIAMGQEDASPRLLDCLGKINTSSEYLLSLLNDILDMSKIESGKLSLEYKTFDLGKMLKELENLVKPQAEQKGLHFTMNQSLQDSYIVGDSLRLNQILINLLGNALKFTSKGGSIVCTVEQTASREAEVTLRFRIQDSGIGISEEQQQKIFYPFEQAEDSTAREFGGTGLGLSICRNLVQMMGGELNLSSAFGEGSEFYFILQMQKAADRLGSENQEEVPILKKFDFLGRRILLVEDIALNVEIAKTILEISHFEVEVAENGKIAVDMFEASQENYYDVLLMDVRMPVMDGLEATRMIRKMDKKDALTVPIIAMTANAFDEDMKKSIGSGMNGHLTKPIDVNKLYMMLDGIIKEREKRDE